MSRNALNGNIDGFAGHRYTRHRERRYGCASGGIVWRIIYVLFMFLMVGMLGGCLTTKANYVPSSINRATTKIAISFPPSELELFRNMQEDSAVSDQWFTIGTWIRNNMLAEDGDRNLTNYFVQKGIKNREAMSSILLKTLHRRLNNRVVYLQRQIDAHIAQIQSEKRLEEAKIEARRYYYEKYNIDDRIKILFPVSITFSFDSTECYRNVAVFSSLDSNWVFDEKVDLYMCGRITKKYTKHDPTEFHFILRVEYVSRGDTKIFGKEIRVGEEIDIELISLKIEGC